MTTTAAATVPVGDPIELGHEHGWMVESRHATSQGWVLYLRCTGCGARRVDVQEGASVVPEPCSVIVISTPENHALSDSFLARAAVADGPSGRRVLFS